MELEVRGCSRGARWMTIESLEGVCNKEHSASEMLSLLKRKEVAAYGVAPASRATNFKFAVVIRGSMYRKLGLSQVT